MTQGEHPKFCDQCGNPVTPNDRFCAGCGKNLSLAAVVQSTSSRYGPEKKSPPIKSLVVWAIGIFLLIGWLGIYLEQSNTDTFSRSSDSISTINNSTSCDDLLVKIKKIYGESAYVSSPYYSIRNNGIDSKCKQALNEINSMSVLPTLSIYPTLVPKPTSLPTNTPVPSPCTNGNYVRNGIKLRSQIPCKTNSREIYWTLSGASDNHFADYYIKGWFYNNYSDDFTGEIKWKVYDSKGLRLDDLTEYLGPIGPGERAPIKVSGNGDVGQIILYKIEKQDW